jgi:hypothetical protein
MIIIIKSANAAIVLLPYNTDRSLGGSVEDIDAPDHLIRRGRQLSKIFNVGNNSGRVSGSDKVGDRSEGDGGESEELHDEEWWEVGEN